MNNDHHQPTAKIYQFVPRIRENGEKRHGAQTHVSAHYLSKNATPPVYSGAWYHDAAIKEDDRKR